MERQAPLLFSKLMAENGITLAADFNEELEESKQIDKVADN
jgi:hypothetical protein